MSLKLEITIKRGSAEIEYSKCISPFGETHDLVAVDEQSGAEIIFSSLQSRAHADLAALLLDGFDHSDSREMALELFDQIWPEETADAQPKALEVV